VTPPCASELQLRGCAGAIPRVAAWPTLRGLHEALLLAGRPVQVRTFHSWFAALLRSAPLGMLHQLGLPTQYELLEERCQGHSPGLAPLSHPHCPGCGGPRRLSGGGRRRTGASGTLKALEAAIHKRTEFALADEHGVVDASVLHFTQQFPAMSAVVAAPRPYVQRGGATACSGPVPRRWAPAASKTCTEAGSELEKALTARDATAIFKAPCSPTKAHLAN